MVVAAIALLVGAGAGPVGAAGGWVPFTSDHVSGSNEIINAITVPAAGDAWVIGYRWGFVGGAAEFRTLAEHSTGGGPFHQVRRPIGRPRRRATSCAAPQVWRPTTCGRWERRSASAVPT